MPSKDNQAFNYYSQVSAFLQQFVCVGVSVLAGLQCDGQSMYLTIAEQVVAAVCDLIRHGTDIALTPWH